MNKSVGKWHMGKFPLDGSLIKVKAVTGTTGFIEEDVKVSYEGLAKWDPDFHKSWNSRFNTGDFVKPDGSRIPGRVIAWFEDPKDGADCQCRVIN